jgi:cytochrome c
MNRNSQTVKANMHIKFDNGSCAEVQRRPLMKVLIGLTAAVLALADAAYAQNVAAGENSFEKCSICHSIDEGATNKIGPELNGLDGRKAGTVANFSYSDANKNSGIIWNEASFKEYIKDPKAKVPDTKMIFAGIKNDKEVDDLWAYLKQYDAEGHVKK